MRGGCGGGGASTWGGEQRKDKTCRARAGNCYRRVAGCETFVLREVERKIKNGLSPGWKKGDSSKGGGSKEGEENVQGARERHIAKIRA